MSDLPPPPGSAPPPPPLAGYPPPPGSFSAPPPGYHSTYGAPTPAISYAGVAARFGAMLIDGLLAALLFVPAVVALVTGETEITWCRVNADGDWDPDGAFRGWCEGPTDQTWAIFGVLMLLGFVGVVLYHALMVGRSGQTLGKRACGVRVVDAATGQVIGTGRALGRYLFASFISGPVCGLGYLWAIWDSRKQTWHDKVVSSVVVRA